ncbi:MAG TPA: methyltransferase domain-containing protein [Longimicrobiales bacterium]|nr:methyltransferase domain-containing protein [Longimicrobiales bacterium]
MARRVVLTFLLGLLLYAPLPQARAQEPSAAELRRRAPAEVMSWRGASWLERPQRAQEEMPDSVLAVMGLEDGDVVADLGAGSGYFTRRIARRIAPSGIVFAVDIQPEMLEMIAESVEEEGLTGVIPVLGEVDDPKLPEGVVDWILLADVYHELSEPEAMLEAMHRALDPATGRVALVEYRSEDGTGDHIRAEHRMSVRQVMREWEPAGFELLELHEFLPSQHLFVFGVAGGSREEPAVENVDLLEALEARRVEASAFADGPERVVLTIRRTDPSPLVVTFPAGTVFDAPEGRGDAVAQRDGAILLPDDAPRGWRVPVERLSRSLPAPGASDALEVVDAAERPLLRDLVWMFQAIDLHPAIAPTVEQLAVWIVSEDLGWDELAAYAREQSIHAANAVALAAAHVNAAGTDVRLTRIWSERDRFLPLVTDDELTRILEQLEGR